AYEEATGRTDMPGFADWLYLHNRMGKDAKGEKGEWLPEDHPHFDGQLGLAVGMLYQHAKHYFKTAMKGTQLVSMFDFSFLATLMQERDLRKSDLVQMNMIEFSPGMEVIRRLLRKGLIEEFPDPEDGRSKRVRLTQAGRVEFLLISEQSRNISRIISGNLCLEEKRLVIPILFKLMKFHEPIFKEAHGAPLEKIIERFVDPA
ncbi:MAG: winged helix DNA-binding protein, partial [Bacteroidota bacterium]